MDFTLRKKMLNDAVLTIRANENGTYTFEVNVWGLKARRNISDKMLYVEEWCNSLTRHGACIRAIDMMLTDLECEALAKFNGALYQIGDEEKDKYCGSCSMLYASARDEDNTIYDKAMYLAYASQHCAAMSDDDSDEWYDLCDSLFEDGDYSYALFDRIYSGTVDGVKVSYSLLGDYSVEDRYNSWDADEYDEDKDKIFRRIKPLWNNGVITNLWIDLADIYKEFCEQHGIKKEDYEEAYQLDEAMNEISDISELEQARDILMHKYLGDLADESDIIHLIDEYEFRDLIIIDGDARRNCFSTVFGWDGEELFYSDILNN